MAPGMSAGGGCRHPRSTDPGWCPVHPNIRAWLMKNLERFRLHPPVATRTTTPTWSPSTGNKARAVALTACRGGESRGGVNRPRLRSPGDGPYPDGSPPPLPLRTVSAKPARCRPSPHPAGCRFVRCPISRQQRCPRLANPPKRQRFRPRHPFQRSTLLNRHLQRGPNKNRQTPTLTRPTTRPTDH